MQPWFFIALACAMFTACSDAASKRIMRENDEWITGTIVLSLGGVFLLPVIGYVGLPPISRGLVELIVILLPLEVAGYYFFLAGVRRSPLSLVLPLLAFTPVFALVSSSVLLGEMIGGWQSMGVGLVCVGTYVLYIDPRSDSAWDPLRAVVSDPGTRRMLAASAIWALTSTLGKKGACMYAPIQFGFLILVCIAVVFWGISAVRVKWGVARFSSTRKTALLFTMAGLMMAGGEVTHFVSLSMAPVACMICVKRISLVFGVILGRVFFGEEHVGYRITGSSLMVTGLFFLYQ